MAMAYLTRNQYLVCRPVRNEVLKSIRKDRGDPLLRREAPLVRNSNKTASIEQKDWEQQNENQILDACKKIASRDRMGWEARTRS